MTRKSKLETSRVSISKEPSDFPCLRVLVDEGRRLLGEGAGEPIGEEVEDDASSFLSLWLLLRCRLVEDPGAEECKEEPGCVGLALWDMGVAAGADEIVCPVLKRAGDASVAVVVVVAVLVLEEVALEAAEPSPGEEECPLVEFTAEWFAGDAELEEVVLEGALDEAAALLEEPEGEEATTLFDPAVAAEMGVADDVEAVLAPLGAGFGDDDDDDEEEA